MKICPVCNSKVFDDMDMCYNCLSPFSENQPKEPSGFSREDFDFLLEEYAAQRDMFEREWEDYENDSRYAFSPQDTGTDVLNFSKGGEGLRIVINIPTEVVARV
ncbi:MAG: hypothetical protein J6Y65_03885 [Eggerthellaceae bacterium]|nr:hypothetical protein [Eggerthellaceae bacterium]